MTTDHSITELTLHNDDRLLSAIQAVVVYASEHACLSEGAREDLSNAATDACKEAFSIAGRNGRPDPAIKVAISGFADRVEIAIEHGGESCLNDRRPNIDRVDCDVRDGKSRTTLVKYAATSKSGHSR
jgi:hypothetical protein